MNTTINLVFTFLFVMFFLLIVRFFSGYFISAYNSDALYPPDKVFPLNSCQSWTNEVRQFDLDEDEKADEVPVLMYHRIINDKDVSDVHFNEKGKLHDTIVLTSLFSKQMELLHENDYITLNTKEFQYFMEGKLDVPKKSILITFDDGYKDNYINAYPILKSYNFNATLYIVTGWVTKYTKKYQADETQYLSVSELKKSCSVFEFQSHTYNMHYLTNDGKAYLVNEPSEKIYKDLKASFKNLNRGNRSFAYPYGVYNESNIEQLKQLGVQMAFTTEDKVATQKANIYEIPRIAILPYDTLDDFNSKIGLDSGKK